MATQVKRDGCFSYMSVEVRFYACSAKIVPEKNNSS